ncbi:hypothetical protein [Nonomuraea sp. NPDC048901]|uniref:hypothetical protein n=1 Tax=Nonomuraea sp. NPDC048901 TaxID=3155627 RepID=UPI0033D2799B
MSAGMLGAGLLLSGAPGKAVAQPTAPTPVTAPIEVSADLTQLPAVGQTATLRVTVNSKVARAGADVAIELPPNLTWSNAPRGLSTSDVASTDPTRAGTVHRAAAHVDLAAGATTYEGAVRATAAGYAEIMASASAPSLVGKNGDRDTVDFTVAASGGESRAGAVTDDVAAVRAVVDTSAIPAPTRSDKQVDSAVTPVDRAVTSTDRPVNPAVTPTDKRADSAVTPTDKPDHPGVAPTGAPGPDPKPVIACVKGTALYNAAGSNHFSQFLRAEVLGFGTVLASGYTDRSGNYKLCFDATGDSPNIEIRFTTDNPHWVVAQDGIPFTWTSWGQTVTSGTVDFGQSFPPSSKQKAAHAFDELADVWFWIPDPCWDGNENPCRKYKVSMGPNVNRTHYDHGTDTIWLQADDPDTPDAVVHEVGHAVMDDLFNDAPMSIANCNPHFLFEVSSDTCAWVEGWADWFPLAVYGKSDFWTNPFDVSDLDLVEYNNTGGITVEANVAGALLDLGDSAISAVDYWDYAHEGPHSIFNTVRDSSSTLQNFVQYWGQRPDQGVGVDPQGSAYNNGIQIGIGLFHDPLPRDTPRKRPRPLPAQNFRFDAVPTYWSVVGARPQSGNDVNVKLLNNHGSALVESTITGSVTDFVAVDSNKQPADTYRATVSLGSDNLPYMIEFGGGRAISGETTTDTITMGGDNVIAARDLAVPPGRTIKVTLTPLNNQDPEIFLLSSASGNFQTRAQAVASSTTHGPGVPEEFTFANTGSTDTWFGFVLTNPTAVAGDYTLTTQLQPK